MTDLYPLTEELGEQGKIKNSTNETEFQFKSKTICTPISSLMYLT